MFIETDFQMNVDICLDYYISELHDYFVINMMYSKSKSSAANDCRNIPIGGKVFPENLKCRK